MNTITLLILIGTFNLHAQYKSMDIPVNIIRATYKIDASERLQNYPNCLISLKEEYKKNLVLQSKETCSEVQQKLKQARGN